MKFRNPIFNIVLVLLVLAAGCARPPAPRPTEQFPPTPFDVNDLKARANFWHDYVAKFQLRVDSKTAKFNARSIVLIKSPQFVRFETFGPIGQTTALYVSNETGLNLLIPSQKVVFTAAEPETLIRYFLGVSLPFEVLRHALTASLPSEQIDNLAVRSEKGITHAFFKSAKSLFDWQFQPEGPALAGIYIRDEGFEGRISYDPPVAVSSNAVPKKIAISSSDWHMTITLDDLQPAQQFQPSAFYLPSLPDVRTVDLDRTNGPQ
jgi:outer membrane biogenesis lipoprotein LolB